MLLNHGADANAKKQDQKTALHLAVWRCHFDAVKALLEQGANVHVRNDLGQTPFWIASRRRDEGIMGLLSEYGAH